MARNQRSDLFTFGLSLVILFIMISSTTIVLIPTNNLNHLEPEMTTGQPNQAWNPDEQPWGQYAKNPSRNSSSPEHGSIDSSSILRSINDPVVNWVGFEETEGSTLYGSIIGNFSSSVTVTGSAEERCGYGDLFPVIVWNNEDSSTSKLSILSGDDADVAWEVDLGSTRDIRSTPAIFDFDGDGQMEIIIAYETPNQVIVDLWSPELRCSESGWEASGHSNERVWSWTSSDYSLSTPSPHVFSSQSGHRAVTQPLVADLSFDGIPEVVLALIDVNTDDPTVVSLPLDTSSAPEPDFEVSLDRGTNPSDPTWAALDSSTSAIVLTTIDSNSGAMWVWRIDGTSGSLDWERVALSGTDQDSDAPRLRLPGPVIAQLDSDTAPEMILTVPTDSNGGSTGQGARFIGMELTSTTEIFNFRATNGFADVQPLPLDTDADGIHDRLCWSTWYSVSSWTVEREGMVGCHDISQSPPSKDWSRLMNRGSGNDNDEIAVSSPIALDINGDDTDEIIVPFGRRLFAFDGESGAQTDVSTTWENALNLPHRTWASPAIADVDGDGIIDILVGDMLISQRLPDFAPLQDNRGLTFNPADPDPGDLVTVTGQIANFGVTEADNPLDVVIELNGVEILRERVEDTEPVAPSGEGGPITVSTTFTAQLGIHDIEMKIDVNGNITEALESNNNYSTELAILAPYVARIDTPSQTTRISPGSEETITIGLTATGSRTSDWILSWNENLNDGWTFDIASNQQTTFTLVPNSPINIEFNTMIPPNALGDESGTVNLILSSVDNSSITFQATLPIEVLRTRGISIEGSTGLDVASGYGRQGSDALAWMRIENLGNAQESTTSLDWTNPSWPGTPALVDSSGNELFTINLQAGESVELFAKLEVPTTASVNTSSNSTLTLCIGQGENELCEDIEVTFISSNIAINPSHIRTLPDNQITRTITMELPSDGEFRWNFASAGLVSQEYSWNVSTTNSLADVSFNSSWLEASGPNGMVFDITLVMDIDENAVPSRLVFSVPEESSSVHNLEFSTHILQVYRAASEIVSPTANNGENAVALNVSQDHRILLRLSNPGNGDDTYTLTGEVVEESAIGFTPQVSFEYFTPTKTLSARANTISTVDINLGESTPALAEFQILFRWTSHSDPSVQSISILTLMAEPDNRWNWTSLSDQNQTIQPGEEILLQFNVTNTGNTENIATLNATNSYNFAGSDNSTWEVNSSTSDTVPIGNWTNVSIGITASDRAWAGTTSSVDVILESGGYTILTMRFNVTVNRTSGWSFDLTSSNLVVSPTGGNITLTLQQEGNTPTIPYYAKASQGWPLEMPQFGAEVDPEGSTTLTVQVTPPEGLLAGTVGTVRILVTDSDGQGQSFQEIPIRIGSAPEIQVSSDGPWFVNSNLGYPTAWINNSGNDLSPIDIEILNLPTGWTTIGSSRVVIPSGQTVGLPIGVVPASNWDRNSVLVGIRITHPNLESIELPMTIQYSDTSFSSSPIGHGVEGRVWEVSLNSTGQNDEVLEYTFTGNGQQFIVNRTNVSLIAYAFGQSITDSNVECDFVSSFFERLGLEAKSGTVARCEITTTANEEFSGRIFLVTSSSEIVSVDEENIRIANNTTEITLVNLTNWQPSYGQETLTLYVLDEYGNTVTVESIEYTSHDPNWNLGIFSISTDREIRVGIEREGWEVLGETTCILEITASDGWSTSVRVDVTGTFAPTVVVEAPAGMETDTNINASIGCLSPFNLESDMSDNSAESWYVAPNQLQISGNDLLISVAITVLITAILAALGILKSPKSADDLVGTQNRDIQNVKKTTAKLKIGEQNTSKSESDEIQRQKELAIQSMQKKMEESESIDDNELKSLEEVIELEEETTPKEPKLEDNTVQGRFAALRNEINSDDEVQNQESIEDRMKKFFGE